MNIAEFFIGPMRVFDRFWRHQIERVERRIKIRHAYVPGDLPNRCRHIINHNHNAPAYDVEHCNQPRALHIS